ncbi:MAG: type II toxin-antitoxin system RelE/ParE family toxin [Paludibacter sp.]|nr:type II toxin-antitoxin system RelE/ParE family toxin [Paludibacter sp.]
MKNYNLVFTVSADDDINNLFNVITFQYKAPLTAQRYVQGLINEIKTLKYSADSYPIQTRKSITQYGQNVRRINYKRIAVIYTVYQTTVYIHRIIPANAIAGL